MKYYFTRTIQNCYLLMFLQASHKNCLYIPNFMIIPVKNSFSIPFSSSFRSVLTSTYKFSYNYKCCNLSYVVELVLKVREALTRPVWSFDMWSEVRGRGGASSWITSSTYYWITGLDHTNNIYLPITKLVMQLF